MAVRNEHNCCGQEDARVIALAVVRRAGKSFGKDGWILLQKDSNGLYIFKRAKH
jgi:hypothetical protein